MKIVTRAERPELDELARAATEDCTAEYNHRGDTLGLYWSRLATERPELQFCLLGDGDRVLARGQSLRARWDGPVEGLPCGIDGAIMRALDEHGADGSCAM